MTIDLSTLNDRQREAVTHLRGPALVLAGAGSGKTRVITYRIAWLIEQGIDPASILGLTFTNKAAEEMRERVAQLVPAELARRVVLSTFHALGVRVLREDIGRLGYRVPFSIVDDGDQRRVLRDVLAELNLSGTTTNEGALLNLISRAKSAMTTPAKLPEARYHPDMPRSQRIFDRYHQALRNLNAVDFDDLIALPTQLLAQHEDVRERYRCRWRFLMVDEFQDTNPAQLRLLEQLVAVPDRNLLVVGDDDQSIYAFRGAVSDYILRFEDHYPGTRVVALEQNYRSVSSVLDAANAVIAKNPSRRGKTLWSDLGAGEKLALIELDTDVDEAEYIASAINDSVAQTGAAFSAHAVLVRSNGQVRALEEALRAARVPYRVVGGQSAFDRKEARDAVAYARLLQAPNDELAGRRVVNYPARRIGGESIAKIDERARAGGHSFWHALREAREDESIPLRTREGIRTFVALVEEHRRALRAAPAGGLGNVLRAYFEAAGLPAAIRTEESNAEVARIRVENIDALAASADRVRAASAEAALDEWLERVSLDKRSTEAEEQRDVATIMTLHSSKGLEFEIVFLAGFNDGTLPHWRSIETRRAADIEEERRLCYVGMTRARRRLIVTRPRFVVKRNERLEQMPSRFLDEIPAPLIERQTVGQLAAAAQRRLEEHQTGIADALAALRAAKASMRRGR